MHEQHPDAPHRGDVPPAPREELTVGGQQEHQREAGDRELAAEQRGEPARHAAELARARARRPRAPRRVGLGQQGEAPGGADQAEQPADRVPLVAGDDQRAHHGASRARRRRRTGSRGPRPRPPRAATGTAPSRRRRPRTRTHGEAGQRPRPARARTSATRRRQRRAHGRECRARGPTRTVEGAADGLDPVAHVRQPGARAVVAAGRSRRRRPRRAAPATPASSAQLDPDRRPRPRAWRRSAGPPGSRSTPPPRRPAE